MTENTERYAAKFPLEIRAGIEGIDGETEQAIVVLLMNEDKLAFSEIQEELSDPDNELHSTTLSNALKSLKAGGLIRQRVRDTDPESRLSSYYTMSEYGLRFVNSLFDSLGHLDGPKGRRRPIISTADSLFDSTEEFAAEIEEELNAT